MAIQVGGTTVLNNSRELTNITGADTTTKNALAAAGVGGKTTLLTDTTFGSTGAVSVSFTGGYEIYRIHLKDIYYSPNNAGNKFLFARFTNSSGSNITSGYSSYYRKYSDSTAGDTRGNENQMYISGDLSFPTNINCSVYMDVYNPYDTGERTMCNYQFISGLNNLSYDQAYIGHVRRNQQIERNNSIYFYYEYPSYGSGNFGGGRLTVYGVSL